MSTYITELNGAWADWDARERCARRQGVEERTWRVRYRHMGSFSGSSIWTDACTRHGAMLSVLRGRYACCLPEVEIIAVEAER